MESLLRKPFSKNDINKLNGMNSAVRYITCLLFASITIPDTHGEDQSGQRQKDSSKSLLEERILKASTVADCLRQFGLKLTKDVPQYDPFRAKARVSSLQWFLSEGHMIFISLEEPEKVPVQSGRWNEAILLAARVCWVNEYVDWNGPSRRWIHYSNPPSVLSVPQSAVSKEGSVPKNEPARQTSSEGRSNLPNK